MLLALMEHDASLDQYGIPVDEATSPDADPMNPNAKYHFEARVLRNFAAAAVEERKKDFKDDPSEARIFYPVRVDHGAIR